MQAGIGFAASAGLDGVEVIVVVVVVVVLFKTWVACDDSAQGPRSERRRV